MSANVPPAARRRVERMNAGGPFGSLFSAPAMAAARAAGIQPVGEVVGCLSMSIGRRSSQYCSWNGYGSWGGNGAWATGESPLTSTLAGDSTLVPYVLAYEAGWRGAVDRMLAEAGALGAHGVVGVTVVESSMTGASDFVAQGTAVRLAQPGPEQRLTAPWAAGFTAEECAAALRAGWVPAGLVFGMAIASKHEDWLLQLQRRSWTSQPVKGLSELLERARRDGRHLAERRARQLGHGVLVVTSTEVSEFETSCGNDRTDLHASSTIQGTVLQPAPAATRPRGTSRGAPPRAVPVISLSDLPLA